MPSDTDEPHNLPASIRSHAAGDATDSFADDRRDQLLTAPGADENDAAPRIDVTEVGPNTKRVDVRDDAAYRPGG